MREFRCDFFIVWSGPIGELGSRVSDILLGGLPLKLSAKYPTEEATLEKNLFGFTIRLDKSSGDAFCLEIIKEYRDRIEYTQEETVGQNQLALYISNLLKDGGLENRFKFLENRALS